MGYTSKDWKCRLIERTDLSTQVIHLTKSFENLKSILLDKKIIASKNSEGFINGNIPATCFMDAPIYAACQNTYYEQKYQKNNSKSKLRYKAIGLMFPKEYAYQKGARPVIYEKPEIAKKFLPEDEFWRIVNFDLSNEDNIIDWTHEREWRHPKDFKFELEKATIIIVKSSTYKSLYKWDHKDNKGILKTVKGIVVLSDVFI